MDKQSALKRLDAIEKEANELRAMIDQPEDTIGGFKIGSFGVFWDGGPAAGAFGYLAPPTAYFNSKYGRAINKNLSGRAAGYNYFRPITEAILPEPVPCNGRPDDLNDDDVVITWLEDGYYAAGKVWEFEWARNTSYTLVMRAKS